MYRLLFYHLVAVLSLLVLCMHDSLAQSNWPKSITSDRGDTIKIYQPQPETFSNDTLRVRAAVSVTAKGGGDPVFGAIWCKALMQTDRSTRMVTMQQVTVTDVHFPNTSDTSVTNSLKRLLEREIPQWDITFSLDHLLATLEDYNKNIHTDAVNTNPPKIIYKNKPAMLVLIDGEPKFQNNKDLGVETVINTTFIILRNKGELYLYGGGQWFQAADINGPWAVDKKPPKAVKKVDKKIKEQDQKDPPQIDSAHVIPEIVVSTVPAELIQSNGDADFTPINGTQLLYMTNTNNDVFIDIQKQQYYVLLSGRWYRSSQLDGPWSYVAADQLPPDFAKIPENSPKDNVLSSVAGTDAAREAVLDAQVPQTAKVDRSQATTQVTYDGDPVFKDIEGTSLQYAVNTKSTVLKSGTKYYCVDNGVWFESANATGPWSVATTRPEDVDKIPASNPTYNVKYVYIYDSTPDYVYVGYTPGYVGTYVYGPTVVYGTGMYYDPWYGPYYYPQPVTYGFSMHYNPWIGFSMGFYFSTGWFNMGIYGGGYGGYWGPPMYRPPYYRPPYYPPAYRPPLYPPSGYRPPPPDYNRPNNPSLLPANINRGVSNPIANYNRGNLYNNHAGVTTNNSRRPMTESPRAENLMTDHQGNIYRKGNKGWEQRQGNNWQGVNNNRQSEINNLDRQQRMQERGNTRATQYQLNRSISRPSGVRMGGHRR